MLIDNTILFFKLWKNIVIRNEIIKHLKLYNLNYNRVYVINDLNDLHSLKQETYREYIKSVSIGNIDKHDLSIIFNELPSSVETLQLFSSTTNKVIKQIPNASIPINITSISMELIEYDYQFNCNTFPSNLYSLTLPHKYNRNIDVNSLPNSITQLKFSNSTSSNQPSKIDSLPSNLKSLTINNHSINNGILPIGIESIHFLSKFSQPISNNLFNDRNCIIQINFENKLTMALSKEWLPINLEKLIICTSNEMVYPIKSLPDNLKYLFIGSFFKHSLSNLYEKTTLLPLNLIKLTVVSNLKLTKYCLNDNLQSLNIQHYKTGIYLEQPDILPLNLKSLYLNGQSIIIPVYPQNLIKLSGIQSTLQLFNLPNTIQKLHFSNVFNNSIPVGIISNLPCLQSIEFGIRYNSEILNESLPLTSLKSLSFEKKFIQPINNNTTLLTTLSISNSKIDISSIISLTALKLKLSTNELFNPSIISTNVNLKIIDLSISTTSTTPMPISTINFLPSLKTLVLRCKHFKNLFQLPISPNLELIIYIPENDVINYKDIELLDPTITNILHIKKYSYNNDKLFKYLSTTQNNE